MDEALRNTIDASYSRNNPYLVAHANITVLANIAFKGALLVFDVQGLVDGVVSIFQRTAEIGLEVVLMHPVARFQVLKSMADRVAVFDNIFALSGILDKDFMACRRILVHDDLSTVSIEMMSPFFLGARQTTTESAGFIFKNVACSIKIVLVDNIPLSDILSTIETDVLLAQQFNGHVVDRVDLFLEDDGIKQRVDTIHA